MQTVSPMGSGILLGLNQVPSLNAVLKALKREEGSLYNCVCSIVDDAQFVEQVVALYPSLPLFPNLRCGLWYVRPPIIGTCYFKSTDGHNGNWSFSTIRLNLHLAEAAAVNGGSLIVDATKRGKRFPDAMSKTVPMWAAVLNRAVQRLRNNHGNSVHSVAPPAAAATSPPSASVAAAAAASDWDCNLYLPPWVSENEANSIQQLLDGWVEQLLKLGADLSTLVATLRKPLRCMWVSQDSLVWQDSVPEVISLAFTPIILVGASATTARQRRCLTLRASEAGEAALCVSYSYFPGAADDEESWACKLAPELMWRHLHTLLAAGPRGIKAQARHLLEQQQQQQQVGAAPRVDSGGRQPNGMALEGAAADAPAGADPEMAAVQGGEPAANVPQQFMERRLHCLLPQGCLPARSAAVQRQGAGIYLLGSTGLAIGSAAAAGAPAVWAHVGAVLHLGTLPLAGMQQEPHPAGRQQQQEQPQQEPDDSRPNSTNGRACPVNCRYFWLPVRSSKQERHSLQQRLPEALRFAQAQLQEGRRLLLCCDSGLDTSVCVAVACLLAFYRLEEQSGGSASGGGLSPVWVGAAGRNSGSSSSQGSHEAVLLPPVVGSTGLSKLAVRQHLAVVSVHYPASRPTRGSLRQVFNFFLSQL